jgi:hypothetical protein
LLLPKRLHKVGVFARGEAFLQYGEDTRQIATQERGAIEPKTREDSALENAGVVRRDRHIFALVEAKPIDLAVARAPDQVFRLGIAL